MNCGRCQMMERITSGRRPRCSDHEREARRDALVANMLLAWVMLAVAVIAIVVGVSGCGGEPLPPEPDGHTPADALGRHVRDQIAPHQDGQCPEPVSVVSVCEGRYLVDHGQLWSCALLSGGALGCWDPVTLRYGVSSCDVCEVRP